MAEEKPTTAYILSLIAGILMLLGGGMGTYTGMMGGTYSNFYGMMGGRSMMGGYNMMGSPSWGYGMGFGIIGLIFGILVIFGAIMLDSKPKEHKTWGTLILIFSILSIFGGMGGFGIGMILGIIGGALAISWSPK
ncbi:MAG: DUF6114 domain-containing protein [Candidatus Bathyarchaeota archaeon]|nr:DUF6114 domain-containing protein [Candidatus Bathyarchaeota archaeon]